MFSSTNLIIGVPLLSSLLASVSIGVAAAPSQQLVQQPFDHDAQILDEGASAGGTPVSKHDIIASNDRVNVSLYVMSRCPDARLCESVFQQVLHADGILDKINFDVGYIGTPNKTEPLGVTCKHGPLECLGNAHQLCLFNHLSISDYSAIVDCQNYPSSFPKDIGTVESVKGCVETVGRNWEESGVGACIEGGKGQKKKKKAADKEAEDRLAEDHRRQDDVPIYDKQTKKNKDKGSDPEYKLGKEARKLLKENIQATYDKGISTSCTIDIASTIVKGGQRRCVVDGGVWRGCDDGHTAQDFIRVIEAEYKNLQNDKAFDSASD
ncbi:hypothetical protein I316_00790 [Kwoniella heveanensis BCC8398]|uniref:Gamma-interferon-inducible lysosomal thiol reductase n=1 Tax=Kwoniella heveanensis BCC8398 TaxID=1296120 RepID=A0A1B9H316_9TREE|nr:hypothetical protein I316_00790 [Kwoniella heveanensis BCC8398]